MPTKQLKALIITATFPSKADPTFGVFVKERIKALSLLEGIEVRVIAPVPWFPPIKISENWYRWSQFPKKEIVEGIEVHRPRYFLPPKIGGYVHSQLMSRAIMRTAMKIKSDFEFNFIDSHFVYPGGAAAVKVARKFSVPVTLTGRGEDMLRFPNLPIIGNQIRRALAGSSHCIGVSREIADAMIANGSSPKTTSVIGNGIDEKKFYLQSMEACRARLGISPESKVILAVGERTRRKGFHLLVSAMPTILGHHPSAKLIVIGRPGRYGRDNTDELNRMISDRGLKNQVSILPPCDHQDLRDWYGASNLFALPSESEGSPNVVLEAMACGTPCVASKVGSIPDDIIAPFLGRLVCNRSSEDFATRISDCLAEDWNREKIANHMLNRTWKSVAEVFKNTLFDTYSKFHSET